MSFKKPFRAVPIRPAEQYRIGSERSPSLGLLGLAAIGLILGGGAGAAILTLKDVTPSQAAEDVNTLAVDAGLVRFRAPAAGDFWPGCNAARAAGTAPIYAGEPGYREDMDGDGDGIACEPHPDAMAEEWNDNGRINRRR